MTIVQASSAGKTKLHSNNAIDMAWYRIAVGDFYCSYVCCSGHNCFACYVGLLLCAAVCIVAVSFRSIVNAKCMPTLPAAALVAAMPLQSLTSCTSSGFAPVVGLLPC